MEDSTPVAFAETHSPGLVWYNQNTGQALLWHTHQGQPLRAAALAPMPDRNVQLVTTGDFNGDGTSELIWRNRTTGLNFLWELSADGLSVANTSEISHEPNLNAYPVGFGDVNGDAKDDLIWRYQDLGQNQVWYMDGTLITGSNGLESNLNLKDQLVGSGDFDGDGTTELLWRDEETGATQLWFLDGLTRASSVSLTSRDDRNWKIDGTLDFNQDGKTDILWRYYAPGDDQGKTEVWLMDGVEQTGTHSFLTIRDLNWRPLPVRLPRLPTAQFPEVQFPEVQFPEVQFPEVQFPEVQFPEVQFPEVPTIESPVVETPQTPDSPGEPELPNSPETPENPVDPTPPVEPPITPPEEPPATPNLLTVNQPNGNESLASGSRHIITWSDQIDGNVKIELYQGTDQKQVIAFSTPSDGRFDWFGRNQSLEGEGYRIRISSVEDPTIEDFSDRPFSIAPGQFTLKTPNGGESLQAGSTYTIEWESNFSPAASVALALYRGDEQVEVIKGISPNDGSEEWTVPAQIDLGEDYRVRIREFGGNRFDASDASFSILPKPDLDLQIFDPNNAFTQPQWSAFNRAVDLWDELITSDKDSSGLFRIAVTQRDDLGNRVLARAYRDQRTNSRTNIEGEDVDINGVDYDNVVEWNLNNLPDQTPLELTITMMHELGHALGLSHENDRSSLMYFQETGEPLGLTETTLERLERLGYRIDRTAVDSINAQLMIPIA